MFGRKKDTAYWIQKTHLLRADEYECSACGRNMTKSKYDPTWVDEAEMLDILG